MKGLSLIQPWASLVVIGAKSIETRGWRYLMKHRGPLVIHASKGFPLDCRELCWLDPFFPALRDAGLVDPGSMTASVKAIPRGALLGTVNVLDSWRFGPNEDPGYPESEFGNFAEGRVGIRVESPRPFRRPVQWDGSLGLFDVPDQVVAEAFNQGVA